MKLPDEMVEQTGKAAPWIIVGIFVAMIAIVSYYTQAPPNSAPSPTSTPPVESASASEPTTPEERIAAALYVKPEKCELAPAASVVYTLDATWNEASLIHAALQNFVKAGKIAFENPAVQSFSIDCRTTFTDQYGKSFTASALLLKMKRSEFEKYDFDALRYTELTDAQIESFSPYKMNPAIGLRADWKDVTW